MDPENPQNNIKIEWFHVWRDPVEWKEFSNSRLVNPAGHWGDTCIGAYTWISDLNFIVTKTGCVITGKTFKMCGLGDIVLIMLDLSISRNDSFELTTWNNRKKLYKHFEWHSKNGYIHEWDVDKSRWLRSCPRSNKDMAQSIWLAEMDTLAKKGKRLGGRLMSICADMAELINDDEFYRIQLQ